ncbi:hypothetical protein ACFQ61_09735 [Streptomyces sp. NPDC056500]|uniref:hypothetical protein n=1 Tax=Streptomyces sp. NPDC056500 TaxID=3345840 RepID=UPI0036918F1D
MLSQNRNHYAAAADAARNTSATRRDPLYASLAFARAAVAHGAAGDDRRALGSPGQAQDALGRSKPDNRPAWIFFYDAAELDGLSAATHFDLGRSADAEFYAHRTLARLKPGLDRNRAFYTSILGLAQIDQGDIEQACATVEPLFTTAQPGSQRSRRQMKDFRLKAAATGSAHARQWLDNLPAAICEEPSFMPEITLRDVQRNELEPVRQLLLDVCAEVHADQLDDPFFAVDRYNERLTSHAGRDGWEAVIGYDREEPVGYAYAAPLLPGTQWWARPSDSRLH